MSANSELARLRVGPNEHGDWEIGSPGGFGGPPLYQPQPWWRSPSNPFISYCVSVHPCDLVADSSLRVQASEGVGACVLQDDFYDLDDATWWKRQLACNQRLRVQTADGLRYVMPSVWQYPASLPGTYPRSVCVKLACVIAGGSPIDGSYTLIATYNAQGYAGSWCMSAEGLVAEDTIAWLTYDASEDSTHWLFEYGDNVSPTVWRGPLLSELPDGTYTEISDDYPGSTVTITGGDASYWD